MSFITGDIKHILSINMKTRYDDIPDQYNRLFMIKMFIISSLIIGFDYFNDTVSCMVPGESTLPPSFVSSTCWIQGFFVYKELDDQVPQSGYYGIPKDLKNDGMYPENKILCTVQTQEYPGHICKPMTKVYYHQYQYMTFYTAALTLLYYFPYIVFKLSNGDVIRLHKHMKGENMDLTYIVQNFFDYRLNSRYRMRARNFMNVVVKLLYITVNVIAFIFTDSVLGGRYSSYGVKWVNWARKKMSRSYEYSFSDDDLAKPGNQLLPSMGICEIHEASQDISMTFVNVNRLICELSPHILYQYCFLVLWFTMVVGILMSITGLIGLLMGYVTHSLCFYEALDKSVYKLYKDMTLREREYMEFIKGKNLEVYWEIIRRLKAFRCHVESDEISLYSRNSSLRDDKDDGSSEQFEFM